MTAAPALADVRRAVADVPDPELPPVTVGMLGMIHDVRVEDVAVHVELLPTFAGCPATDMIGEDVQAAVRAIDGVTDVTVRFRFDPPWTSERITAEGHEALRSFGISPPAGGRPTVVALSRRVPCPYCGSDATEMDSPFGPTPCRSIRFCTRCRQPFEAFKDL